MNHDAILALDAKLRSISVVERKNLVSFLRDLDLLDQEHAYVALSFTSTFDYLVRRHHLPEGTAWRRVNAMRLIRRFPVLESALEDGRINTTQLGILAPLFTAENVDELLRRATHLTKAETKELAVSIRPKQVPADGLRRLPTPAPRPAYPSPLPANAPGGPSPVMVLRIPEPTGQPVLVAQPLARSIIEPVAKDRWQWRVGLDGERKAKLDTLRGYLGHKIPDGDPQKIFDQMLDDSLEKHGKRLGFVEPKHPRKPPPPKPPTPGKRAPIPRWVRRAVLKRDGYQCTEFGPDGERCPCKDRLELDHRDPANVTGSSTVDDLTTKCRAHNLYRAMRRYGIDYVRRRIEEARREREARRSAKAPSNPPTCCEPVAPWGARGSAAAA